MKKYVLTILAAFAFIQLSLGNYQGEGDEEEIKTIIQTAYVDGLQNKGDLEVTRKGFHEGFELLGIYNNALTKYPIYSWIEYAEQKKEEDPQPPAPEELVTCKFINIDITGNAAMAKIELYQGGRQIFTDYLSFYKFEEGWRIVNKIYYRIPEEKEDR
jgi:hypothetical protein